MAVDASSIDIEQASETVYKSLERDVAASTSVAAAAATSATAAASQQGLRYQDSLTALSLSNLGLCGPPTPSAALEQGFSVTVESLRLSAETQAAGLLRSLGLQMGLFHGGKRLCPLRSVGFKGSADDDGVVLVEKVFRSHSITRHFDPDCVLLFFCF